MILFNSWEYILFLLAVVVTYWLLDLKKQNWLLLIASIFFYATWDWRFIFLILISTSVDYFAALQIASHKDHQTRQTWLIASISVNLGILAIFKYYSFFLNSLQSILNHYSLNFSYPAISIILPIGISFYTLKAIGYVIEVYRGNFQPERSFLSYMLFVVFFPLLVAGPIERARNLLPQITHPRQFTWVNIFSGIDLIIWGLIKKVVVADNIAYYVTLIFNLKDPSTLLIIIGAFGFGIQLLADFSGYTDIARGSSQMLGFNIIKNFNSPYAARNPSDFWNRWHISLSSYVRDYIYIPLGGDRCSKIRYLLNILITWFIMGLWHGAFWHYVLWGIYHGGLTAFHKLFIQGRTFFSWIHKNIRTLASVLFTYIFVNLGWVLFRIEHINDLSFCFDHYAWLRSFKDQDVAYILSLFIILYSIPIFAGLIWNSIKNKIDLSWYPSIRIIYYTAALLTLMIFGGFSYEFVYFQF